MGVLGFDEKKTRSLILLLLPVLLTFPLVLDINRVLSLENVGNVSVETSYFSEKTADTAQVIYLIHWFKHALTQNKPLLKNDQLFYPDGYTPTNNPFFPGFALVGGLLSFFTTETQAYNLLLLSNLFFSALAMLAFANWLSKDKTASFAASVAYVATPYVLAHATMGHVNIVNLSIIPLIFLYLEKSLGEKGLKNPVVLGVLCGAQLLCSTQYSAYLSIMIPLYVLTMPEKKSFKKVLTVGEVAFFSALAVSGWYLAGFTGAGAGPRSLENNLRYSALFEEFFLASSQVLNNWEHMVYLSTVPIIVLLASTYTSAKKRDKKSLQMLFLFAFSAICSMGPFAELAPYTLFLNHWPLINAFRAPSRFHAFTLFFLSTILALFFKNMGKKDKKIVYLAALVILAEAFFSSPYSPPAPTYSYADREENSIYKRVEETEGDFSVTEYPAKYRCVYEYNIMLHGKKLVGGCGATHPASHADFLEKCTTLVLDLKNESCVKALWERNTRYVFYHSDEYKNWDQVYEYLLQEPMLEEKTSSGSVYLFEIKQTSQ